MAQRPMTFTTDPSLPPLPGTYAIVLRLDEARQVAVGQLGHFLFPSGYYVYIGSALGPGGLRARVARHLRTHKQPRWHIDHLLAVTKVVGLHVATGAARRECAWSRIVQTLPEASIAVRGFGSSDCRCPSHLVHLAHPQEAAALQTVLLPSSQDLAERLRDTATARDDAACETLCRALSAEDDPRPALSVLLRDPDPDVRWWAVRSLCCLRDPAVAPQLICKLRDPDGAVRAAAAWALGELHVADAVEALLKLLADPSGWIRRIAADALRLIGEPSVAALSQALVGGSDGVRVQAAYALGRLSSHAAVPALLRALDDPSFLVRTFAIDALQSLGLLDDILVM